MIFCGTWSSHRRRSVSVVRWLEQSQNQCILPRLQPRFNPWAAINEGYLAGVQAALVPAFKWIYSKVTEIFVGWQRCAKFHIPSPLTSSNRELHGRIVTRTFGNLLSLSNEITNSTQFRKFRDLYRLDNRFISPNVEIVWRLDRVPWS